MASCYILYSPSLDKYYIGATTLSVEERLDRHNEGYYDHKWTQHVCPWIIFISIPCNNMIQAEALEKHIKRMKSRTYIENLNKYPEIIQRLVEKYSLKEC